MCCTTVGPSLPIAGHIKVTISVCQGSGSMYFWLNQVYRDVLSPVFMCQKKGRILITDVPKTALCLYCYNDPLWGHPHYLGYSHVEKWGINLRPHKKLFFCSTVFFFVYIYTGWQIRCYASPDLINTNIYALYLLSSVTFFLIFHHYYGNHLQLMSLSLVFTVV